MITKTLLSTLLKKKARLLLLLFSIAACSSLLFANVGFQRTSEQTVYSAATHWCGNAELYIATKQSIGAKEWIDPDALDPWKESFEYAYGLVRSKAFYAHPDGGIVNFTALGTDIEEFNDYNPLSLRSGSVEDWAGFKAVIGNAYAQKLGVGVGDALDLEINGEPHVFLIAGVSEPQGLFLRDLADSGFLLMPKKTLADIAGGDCSLLFIKTKDPSSVPGLKQELMDALPEYAVNLGIDPAIIQAETIYYVTPFWISSSVVVIMSVFIIFSCFNIIVNERIPVLGILRSAGCTRRKANRILIVESMGIGLVGGAIGCFLGIGVLYIIKTVYFSGDAAAVDAPIIFGAYEALFTIAAAVVITAISAMAPILRTTKIPVKNIILNDYQQQKNKRSKAWPIGVLLMAPCAIVPVLFGSGFTGMLAASAAIALALIGLILLIPHLCGFAAFATRNSNSNYEIALGVRNIGDFKAMVNNIRLFAAIIAIMAFMMTLFNSMGADLRDSYAKEKFDIQMELRESGPESLGLLSGMDGVSNVNGIFVATPEIPSHGSFFNELVGIEDEYYFKMVSIDIPSECRAALDALGDGRNIITTGIMRDKLGLKIGDTLTLQLDNGAYDYEITGFVDTNRSIGHMGFISAENYKAGMGVENYTFVCVVAEGDPDVVKGGIERLFASDILSIQTKDEMEAANVDKVMGVFNAINTYAWFAMLIGILGIINNMVACFLSRQRNLALYRCVGMSVQGMGRMLMTEAAATGIVGVVAGLLTGFLMMLAAPSVVGLLWGNITVVIPVLQIAALCAIGIAAMLLCFRAPFAISKNISIMDKLRYE
ncbi:MAG: FtsX-like permease family protein [Oscillospiraceae bacterium]|nr:FtsX-like permease family protein [Oscillospiraceae bacterium]